MPLLVLAVALNGYSLRCVWFGQLGIVLTGLLAIDLLGAGRRTRGLLTGIAIGIKLTPAVMLVWFVARREWRSATVAFATFLATVVLGVAASPHAAARYWDGLVVHHSLGTGVPTWFGNSNNQGLTNAVMMLMGGVSTLHLHVGRVVAVGCAVAAVAAGARAAVLDRRWLAVGLLGVASCLVTTSTWDHHYVWFVALLIAAAAGDLRGCRASVIVLMVWTLWSLGTKWPPLMYVPAHRMSRWQLAEAVATPALAGLFCLCCCAELVLRGASQARPDRRRWVGLVSTT